MESLQDILQEEFPEFNKDLQHITLNMEVPLSLTYQSWLMHFNQASSLLFNIAYDNDQKYITSPSSLFAITVADSNARKTSIDNCFDGPRKKLSRKLTADYKEAVRKLKIKKLYDQHKLRQPRNLDLDFNELDIFPDKVPLVPTIVSDSPTVEGIAACLIKGQPFHSLFTNEGGSLFGGYSFKKENALKTMSVLSKMKDGFLEGNARASDMTEARLMGGEIYGFKDNLTFSMFISLQSKPFRDFIKEYIKYEQGLLNRCLLLKPEDLSGTRSYKINKELKFQAKQSKKDITDEIDFLYSNIRYVNDDPSEGLEKCTLYLEDSEEELLTDCLRYFEAYCGPASPFIEGAGFLGKRREHMMGLASTMQAKKYTEKRYFPKWDEANKKYEPRAIERKVLINAIKQFNLQYYNFYSAIKSFTVHDETKIESPLLNKLPAETFKFLRYLEKAITKQGIELTEPFTVTSRMFDGVSNVYKNKARIQPQLQILLSRNIIQLVDNNQYIFVQEDDSSKEEIFPQFIFEDKSNSPEDPGQLLIHLEQEVKDDANDINNDNDSSNDNIGDINYNNEEIVIDFSNDNKVRNFATPEEERAHRELLRDRIDIEDYIRYHFTIPLKKIGGNICCPFHNDKSPSLLITKTSWNCFAGCGGGDIFDLIAKCNNLDKKNDFPKIIAIAEDFAGISSLSKGKSYIFDSMTKEEREESRLRFEEELIALREKEAIEKENSDEKKISYVQRLYMATHPLEDLSYYHNRCATSKKNRLLTGVLSKYIRFNSKQYYTEDEYYPAIVAAMINPNFNNSITAIHQTYLNDDLTHKRFNKNSEKIVKKIYGIAKGAFTPVISDKLFNADQELTLIITEGIETAISAYFLLKEKVPSKLSTIAAVSASNMPNIIISDKYTKIIIAGENDETGRAYAELAKDAYEKQGKAVEIYYPPEKFKDFNDYDYFLNSNNTS